MKMQQNEERKLEEILRRFAHLVTKTNELQGTPGFKAQAAASDIEKGMKVLIAWRDQAVAEAQIDLLATLECCDRQHRWGRECPMILRRIAELEAQLQRNQPQPVDRKSETTRPTRNEEAK